MFYSAVTSESVVGGFCFRLPDSSMEHHMKNLCSGFQNQTVDRSED